MPHSERALDDWRNVPVLLIDPREGEQRAQACEKACQQQLLSQTQLRTRA